MELTFFGFYVRQLTTRFIRAFFGLGHLDQQFRSRDDMDHQGHHLLLIHPQIREHQLNFGQTAKAGEGIRMVGSPR
jgi:hypothetical protein